MRRLPYALIVGIALAIVLTTTGPTSAEEQPAQFGGGYLSGFVYGYSMYDELIPINWATITASNDLYTFTTYSYADGGYGFYLPTGTFNVTVDEPGFIPQSRSITISDGSSTSGFNFFLERSNVPIPEFPTQFISLLMIAAIAGALVAKRLIKRKRQS